MVFSIIFMSQVQAVDKLPGKGITVQPVQTTITEETFQHLIVMKALEQLGYNVLEIKELDPNMQYPAIANGDVTFTASGWDPLHSAKYKSAGGDDVFYRKGHYVTNAAQGYLIDKTTAEKYKITNIEQLRDPKIAQLFDANGDGKADLIGCNPGWGCEKSVNTHLEAYKLTDTVDHIQGNYSSLITDVIVRYKEGQPVLYYSWTPTWTHSILKPGRDVVWLEVPFTAMPKGEKGDSKLPNGKNYGFQPNSMRIIANKDWAEKNPAAAELFAIMELPLSAVSKENNLMHNGENSQADIERHADAWIHGHKEAFDNWIERAKKAAE